jgi:GNAT superfamily N-acetyltransferase
MRLEQLNVLTWPAYAHMTRTACRELMAGSTSAPSDGPGGTPIAVGAAMDERPVGLAVARMNAQRAECLSLYVTRDVRGRGIGTALLARLESAVAAAGGSTLSLSYDPESGAAAGAVERLLARGGWPDSRDRLRFLMLDGSVMQARWFASAVLPSSYRLEPWSTLSAADREVIDASQRSDAWIPPHLVPWRFESGHDPDGSFVLRRDRRVVGWLLARVVDATTLHYANVFVRPSENRAGHTYAALALVAEAIARQARRLGERSRGLFEVAPDNVGFRRFVDRHLRDYLILDQELTRATKPLRPPGGVAG